MKKTNPDDKANKKIIPFKFHPMYPRSTIKTPTRVSSALKYDRVFFKVRNEKKLFLFHTKSLLLLSAQLDRRRRDDTLLLLLGDPVYIDADVTKYSFEPSLHARVRISILRQLFWTGTKKCRTFLFLDSFNTPSIREEKGPFFVCKALARLLRLVFVGARGICS